MSKKSSTLCVTSWNKSQDLTSPAEQIEKKRKGKNEVITFFLGLTTLFMNYCMLTSCKSLKVRGFKRKFKSI